MITPAEVKALADAMREGKVAMVKTPEVEIVLSPSAFHAAPQQRDVTEESGQTGRDNMSTLFAATRVRPKQAAHGGSNG